MLFWIAENKETVWINWVWVQIHFVTRVALFIGSKRRNKSGVFFYGLTLDKHLLSIHVPEASFSFKSFTKYAKLALSAEYTEALYTNTIPSTVNVPDILRGT